MAERHISFEQLSDVMAFRIVVDTQSDCYKALGLIHQKWPMVPGRFKDYISTPKRNNYRSLHTTVVGPKGMRIEMQIRNENMDRIAEDGVAASRPVAAASPTPSTTPSGGTSPPTARSSTPATTRLWTTSAPRPAPRRSAQ